LFTFVFQDTKPQSYYILISQIMNKILVPFDFSSASERAVLFAGVVARTSGYSIDLIHVHNDKKVQLAEVEKSLASLCKKIQESEGVPCGHIITGGSIFTDIPKTASSGFYKMVIIATHGIMGFRQKMTGAYILRMVRAITAPVLVVHKESAVPSLGFKRLVFPVGGHARFDRQIDAAVLMAGIFDLEVQIYSIRKSGDEWTPALKKNIQAAEKAFSDKGIKFRRVEEEPNVLSVGYARQTIRYAKNNGCDLISIMSVPTREHYYFAQADKEEVLTNEHGIAVLCSSDLEIL
jgi:nucleotide-binding universal stress UspA family protein